MKLFESLKQSLTIIDVESTCWETEQEQGDKPNEVVEIGICNIINNKLKKIPSLIIKPQYSEMSPFCTRLTTLTQDQVDKGMDPKYAYSKLKNLFVSNIWASWGKYDLHQLERMFKLYKLPNVLPIHHINIRALFAQKVLNSDNFKDAPNNPKDAITKIGLQFQGVNHRGDDDAYNIARLYLEIITR